MTASWKSVANCNGAVLKADKVSCLMPFFTWERNASLHARERLPIEMNTKSVRCSMALAAGDAGIKVHQILQLICCLRNLGRTLSFTLTANNLQLSLHVLWYLKKSPIKTRCLIANNRSLSSCLFPSSQGILRYATRCWWGR